MSVRIATGADRIVSTTQRSPAAAAYAATAAPWLPEVETITVSAPSAAALLTATEASRSFHDHVGLRDSSLRYSSPMPSSLPSLRSGSRGVPPSPSDTSGRSGASGSASRHRQEAPSRVIA
jgi:hypothetical protein